MDHSARFYATTTTWFPSPYVVQAYVCFDCGNLTQYLNESDRRDLRTKGRPYDDSQCPDRSANSHRAAYTATAQFPPPARPDFRRCWPLWAFLGLPRPRGRRGKP